MVATTPVTADGLPQTSPLPKPPSPRAWKAGERGQPPYPADFEVLRKAVLQVTDLKSNHNKYYAIELHAAAPPHTPPYRVFTHYGRTDDLETNPDSGQKECRYFVTVGEAAAAYQSIYRAKTGLRKGYREVALASSRIGSAKARGQSSGEVDAKTIRKITSRAAVSPRAVPPSLGLHPGVQDLVRYLYAEATNALTSTVAARITANGIETPLGILTIGQIEKGEAILSRIYAIIQRQGNVPRHRAALESLSGEFYSVIPHRIGRSRAAVAGAVIDSVAAFGREQETLQLMKDMLQVNGVEGGGVLYDAKVDQQYLSLKCDVGFLEKDDPQYREIERYVTDGRGPVEIRQVYTLRRADEHRAFADRGDGVGNHRLLFHGSGIQNWVGILSRGILLPKVAVSMGVRRTDAGWLGNGIYFGDVARTSAAYTTPGRSSPQRRTRLMALATVALGQVKDYTRITYGLSAPPAGYDSCHGVRHAHHRPSQFADDEYVVYDTRQQRLEYLVEFTQ